MTTLNMILGNRLLSNTQSTDIHIDELKNKTIGLYFSAQWCARCRNFTTTLSKTYLDAFNENRHLLFDIVFISADSDEESFAEYYQDMPWKALPYEDRDRAKKLNHHYRIQDIPSLIILKSDGEVLTFNGDEEFQLAKSLEKWTNGETIYWNKEPISSEDYIWTYTYCHECYMKPLIGSRFGCFNRECGYDICDSCYSKGNTHQHELIEFWSPKKIYSVEQIFSKNTLIGKNNEQITMESLENKCIGLYFAADWIISCSSLTSTLIELYQRALKLNLPFDIILISADDNQKSFDKLYGKMPWRALPFENQITQLQLKNYFSVKNIPAFIVLKPTGELLTKSGCKYIENNGIQAIQTWCKGEKIPRVPDEFIWSSIACDGCEMLPLIGQRFHCEICSDFDLCLACKEKGHKHELVIISQPDTDAED
ncbi:hypothetical protein I4U23_023311 [Adineta vaga]|nr:hypothetical protein I4U23_023311 [Adineta vaga]